MPFSSAGFNPTDVDRITGRPHCLIYFAGFCMGVAEVFDRQTEEIEARGVLQGGIIWALAGKDFRDYDRGNNAAIDAEDLFIRMQAGQMPELRQTYSLAVREGQAFASGADDPKWLHIFIRDGLEMENQ